MIKIDKPHASHHFADIIKLQTANLKHNVVHGTWQTAGFVTVQHDEKLLQEMHATIPHVIALDDGRVVAYALSMARDFAQRIPVLIPMFATIDGLTYEGNLLSDRKYYVMGQICVDADYRGRGIVKEMYALHKTLNNADFDYFITEVSSSNPRSMRAHQKVGFKTIHSYRDATDEWHVLLWDWQ